MSAESRQRQTAKRQQDKTRLTELRRRAEHRVFPLTRPSPTLVQEDVEGLLYELQVHQIELEKLLTAKLHCVREDERRRIAEKLRHDHCQRLSACIAEIHSAAPRLEGREREQLETIATKLLQLRHEFSHVDRHPDTNGAELSLARVMRRYVDHVSASANVPIEFREHHVDTHIPKPIAQCMYRVMKEGLANVVKHAGCTQAVVTLTGSAGGIELRVMDDGRGFDLTDVFRAKQGKGLMGIQNQVCLLEGKVAIQSRPGQGAELKIFIPVQDKGVSVVPAAYI
jgi:signal transduction histidine kinase